MTDHAIAILDKGLTRTIVRSYMPTNEVADILLDVRQELLHAAEVDTSNDEA